jgi:hypothetical protein
MARQSVITRKKRGPPATGKGTLIGVRLQPRDLSALDQWIDVQSEKITRPEAIRRLVEHALASQVRPGRLRKEARRKASDMAARTVEHLGDKSLPVEEQARRKRALIKGPREFRHVRSDLPDKKTR